MRIAHAALLALVVAAGGACKLLALGVSCESDANCRDDEACLDQVCERVAPEELDAGRAGDAGDDEPLDDAGAPPDECPRISDEPERRVVLAENPYLVVDEASLAALLDAVVIEGNVKVPGAPGFVSFALPDLVEITGDLLLDHDVVPAPGTFAADLPCLARVGRELIVDGDVVESLALPRLAEVAGALRLEDTTAPASFPALTRVGGTLRMDNTVEDDLGVFGALTDVPSLHISSNPQLTTLTGLGAPLTDINILVVRDNPALANLAGVDGLQDASGLRISTNPLLPECEAEALRDRLIALGFRGPAYVLDNDELAQCAWLATTFCPPALSVADCTAPVDLVIASSDDVTANVGVTCANNVTIQATATEVCLPALAEIQGTLTLADGNTATRVELPSLRSLGALYGRGDTLTALELPRLETVGGVEIFWLGALERVLWPRLDAVTGALRVRDTTTTTFYFPQLESVGDVLQASWHSSAAELSFPALLDVVGALELEANDALVDARGFRQVRSVGGLTVTLNVALASLAGLSPDTVTGDISIDGNNALVTLDDLDAAAITFTGNYINVQNNACLDEAAAATWAQTLAPGANTVQGNGATCAQ